MPLVPITALPDAPSRLDEPSVFVTKADAFVAALPDFVTETNDLAEFLNGLSEGTLDGNLSAIAGLTSAANTFPYFTGSETAALADITSFALSLLNDADASEALSTLGVSTFIKTLLNDADAAAARATLGVTGTGDLLSTNNLSDVANAATARANLSAASVTQTAEAIGGFIASPSNKDYRIVVKIPHGGTITETTTISVSGTCTATFKVNSTALGGTANSVSSSEQSQAHSGTNTFVAGDDIALTVSANATCVDMNFTIKYTRTLS